MAGDLPKFTTRVCRTHGRTEFVLEGRGYDRYIGALHFHHLDPAQKEFGISRRGFTRSIQKMREEAAKCVLLCSNCHPEVEGGIATLPGTEAA